MARDLEVDRMVSRGTQRRGIWPRALLVVAGDVVVGPEALPMQPGGRKISKG
jgi:hypothetical protein